MKLGEIFPIVVQCWVYLLGQGYQEKITYTYDYFKKDVLVSKLSVAQAALVMELWH